MTIDISGRIASIMEQIKVESKACAIEASFELKNSSLEVLRGARSGRRYGNHVASAPGEPPAVKSGALREFWRPIQTGDNGMNPAIESDVEYTWLDTGGHGIAPRPYSEKIKEMTTPKIIQIYSELTR